MARGRVVAGRPVDLAAWLRGPASVPLHARIAPPGERFAGLLRRLLAAEADARRPFLWLPVAFGAGIALYFMADTEPMLAAPLIGFTLCAAAATALRRGRGPGFCACLLAALAMAGFAAATLRTRLLEAPVLDRVRMVKLTAFVESLERRGQGGVRLVLRPITTDLPAAVSPIRLRVSVASVPAIRPGEAIALTARLLPPPPPSRPGGYDFARDAYFERLGAVGSVAGAIRPLPDPPPLPRDLAVLAAIDTARNALTDRIAATVGGAAGGVAAALVTGKRGLIPEETNADLRAAGIYHVVSISGLHLVLAAGMVFWIVRALLALVPGLALRCPIKKWAALAAMVAGSAYTVFAGGDVATVRSLVMTLVLLGAILVDRPALSMRNLAVAALVVLTLEPETLLAPGFQMSFAAVAGLVAAFETSGRPAAEIDLPGLSPAGNRPVAAPAGLVARLGRGAAGHVLGTLLSTLVAEAATAPFGLFHFQRFTPYGLVGNALSLPLVSLVVMPAALVGALALPFGLDAPIWSVMGWGVSAMLDVAAAVAAWPGATRAVPAFGVAALGLLTAGLLWLTVWRTPLRLAGLALLGAGVALAAAAVPPDVVVAADGRSLVIRGTGGRLVTLGRQSGDFALDQWLRADGDTRSAKAARDDGGAACDPFGCVVRLPDGRAVAHVTDAQAFEEDCVRAAVVVTPLRAPSWCAAETIDAAILERSGAMALTARAGGFDRTPDRRPLRDRPWARAIPPLPLATAPTSGPARPDDATVAEPQ